VTEDVVRDISGDPLAVIPRDPGLAREVPADVGEHPLAERDRVHVHVEQLRAQLADHGQVDPVLDLRERIRSGTLLRGRPDG
jgi:hypothetical protein